MNKAGVVIFAVLAALIIAYYFYPRKPGEDFYHKGYSDYYRFLGGIDSVGEIQGALVNFEGLPDDDFEAYSQGYEDAHARAVELWREFLAKINKGELEIEELSW